MARTEKFLTSKFQVGSSKSDKMNYSLGQKVFHIADVRKEVLESKRVVQKKKQNNILGTEQAEWNQSTIADPRQKDVSTDLKRQLLKVRAGLMDEYVQKPSKMHSEAAIRDRQKFIVSVTGKGPIGKLTGQWMNCVDERGLPTHTVEEWPSWNASTVTQRKEQPPPVAKSEPPPLDTYISPMQSVVNINDRLRERKIDFQDLKEQFKRELKAEFPNASEERLQAMAQRLLSEKLLADEKMARFPVQHENFRPNLAMTTQDRRYKVYSHPGTWAWSEAEKRHCWSCCMNFKEDSPGCEFKIANPDAWSVAGFERYYQGRNM